MSRSGTNSSPELFPSGDLVHNEESVLEVTSEPVFKVVAANVKLLLKLIKDHCKEDDGRKTQRIAGMITILDDVKSRIEKSQPSQRKGAELRRCNTDLRRGHSTKERKPPLQPLDLASAIEEVEKLRRELSATMTARKSLEKMFSSLGKEKQMIAAELARKVHELIDMEELVNDLRVQNQTLTEKVKACAAEHKGKKEGYMGGDAQAHAALQERNKSLSEQLLKSLDGYRSMKRRFKESQEEQVRFQTRMSEVVEEVAVGLESIRGMRETLVKGREGKMQMEKELEKVERMLVGFQTKLSSKASPKRMEGGKSVAALAAKKQPSGIVQAAE